MGNNYENIFIRDLAKEDQPRQKFVQTGPQMASNADLVAILIGSGSTQESAIQLAQRILKSVEGDLNELGRLTIPQLRKFRGIGEAKAVTIAAALELGKRRQMTEVRQRAKITNSEAAYKIMAPLIADLQVEQFWIILLNRANEVIAKRKISEGGVAETVVDTKVVFRIAVDLLASSIILAHNHPSGNLNPGKEDKTLTKTLVQAGKIMSIRVLDHLIISERGYTSFADEGMI